MYAGTAWCTGSRGACWPGRRGRSRCRCRRARLRARAAAVAATTASSAARMRWPSVWPSGIRRTPAETRLAATACRKARSAGSTAMPWPRGRDADRNRIGNRTVAIPRSSRSSAAHGQAALRRLDEGASLRGRLQGPLLRRRQGRGELGDVLQCVIVRRPRPRDRRARSSTASQKPPPSASTTASQRRSARRVADVAGLDRPFEAARIREGADRIGRRQPRHQAIERAPSEVGASCHDCVHDRP